MKATLATLFLIATSYPSIVPFSSRPEDLRSLRAELVINEKVVLGTEPLETFITIRNEGRTALSFSTDPAPSGSIHQANSGQGWFSTACGGGGCSRNHAAMHLLRPGEQILIPVSIELEDLSPGKATIEITQLVVPLPNGRCDFSNSIKVIATSDVTFVSDAKQ